MEESTINSIINNYQTGGSHNEFPNTHKLLEAFEYGKWDLIDTIIKNNQIENLECKDKYGNTVLHNIILYARNNPAKIDTLIAYIEKLHCNPTFKKAIDIPNSNNKTAFYLVVQFANDDNNDKLFNLAAKLDEYGANKIFDDVDIITDVGSDVNTNMESSLNLEEFERAISRASTKPNIETSDNKSIDNLINSLEKKINNQSGGNLYDSDNNNVNTEQFINSLSKKYIKPTNYSETSENNSDIFIKQNNSPTSVSNSTLKGGSYKITGIRRLKEHTEDKTYNYNSDSNMSNELGKMLAVNNKSKKDDLHQKFLDKIIELLTDGKLKKDSKNLYNKKTVKEDAQTIKSFLYRKEKEKHPEKSGFEHINDLNNMSDSEIAKAVKKIPDLSDLRSEILKHSSEKKKERMQTSSIEKQSSDSNKLESYTSESLDD